ncbi:S9 family peptidase [Solimonas marina]|uniref:Prolyl oligopeptidase family serine peptidase n=1 Tax=Solimonas marina TaxID=2714601 RepID=A0A969W5L4_9GAMM|nr:prolyl oligopeptidase family serine peptidase [Solimonas marina]NKF20877.1 prolyl oligopeptidase family serine peptidase [Solimonas marina]
MRRIALAAAVALVAAPAFAAAQSAPQPLTMEQIMANPDWIGQPVEAPYWSADSQSIYYELKRDGSEIHDLYRVAAVGGDSVKLSDDQRASAGGPPVFDAAHRHVAWLRHGDVFVRDLAGGPAIQVTRTPQNESDLQWSADGSAVQYRDDQQWFSYRLGGGAAVPVAIVNAKDDPDDDKPDALGRLQLHLFKSLRHDKAEHDAERQNDLALDQADDTRAPRPFWLGKDVEIVGTSLSPSGQWMLAVTQPAVSDKDKAKQPAVNHYVTDSGYPEPEDARTYVGRNPPAPQTVWLLDLASHEKYELSLDKLPGIDSDPLAKLRKQTQKVLRKDGHDDEAKALDAPKIRGVSLTGFVRQPMAWSDDGQAVAIQLSANDHKDRWIASVDLKDHKLVTQNHLHDPAWINWSFNDFGFVPHSHTLWYLSEASGYSQLYTQTLGGRAQQLTSGHFEVSEVTPSPQGDWFYMLTNQQSPADYDVYRVPVAGGDLQRVTRYQGLNNAEGGASYVLSPDGGKLAVVHSSAYVPPQLAVINVDGSGAQELTDTRTAQYKAMQWIPPQIVQVPSSHGAGVIYAKVYKSADDEPSQPHPAVFFVHGAGYLQDVTNSWSYYFREQMFNNMLAQEGYVVMDMDYRASAGYGRDWRTAIYRQMGHPELEDLLDGKAWLVKNQNVDPNRVGIYGGSYGGFMTEIALLRAPGEFAAGAALRPPSDWTSYNDDYTSDILNDPQIDPEAYRISSPIEYADQLQDPLLICHGLIDDNVMASDSIRLYQRFIELHKDNFWLSLYPMDRHAFEHADDWYDEYRRVHELMTRYVKDRYSTGVPVAKAP